MEDSKLLELAGLAAGETYTKEHNPLERDDLALRLAVALGMTVRVCDGHVIASSRLVVGANASEDIGTDPCAATRRAIVRAAAEIGRQMP